MLRLRLKLKLKNGEIKIVIFEQATDLFIDYEKNKLSLFDYQAGTDYHYHFRETGKEREQEAIEILEIEILQKKEV